MIKNILSVILSLVILANASPALALTDEQRRVISSGASYFNVDGTSGLCKSDSVELLGSDNTEKIFNYFITKGLSVPIAAGITGNAVVESRSDPTIVSPSGYRGIFQWDRNNRWPRLEQWTNSNGYDPLSLEGQLEFSWFEANERGNIEQLREFVENTNTSEDNNRQDSEGAAWHWGRYYEVAIINGSTSSTPFTNVQGLSHRMEAAIAAEEVYGSSSVVSLNQGSQTNCGVTNFAEDFVVYSQYDPAWRYTAYSSSTIGRSGCGPSAMAMIITNLTGEEVTPVETSSVAADRGMYVPGVGSSWSIGAVLADHWGLTAEPLTKDVNAITNALRQGKLVITPGGGPKPFTSGGHFIVIRAVTNDGKFLVGDSGHTDTNNIEYDAQFIVNNMRDGGIYAISQ